MFWRFDTKIGRSVPAYFRYGHALYMTPGNVQHVRRLPLAESGSWTPA